MKCARKHQKIDIDSLVAPNDRHAVTRTAIRHLKRATRQIHHSPRRYDRPRLGGHSSKNFRLVQGGRCVDQQVKANSLTLTAEWWTLLVASFMMVMSTLCFFLLETEYFGYIRSVFDFRPWRNMKGLLEDTNETPCSSPKACPFTGKEAHGTCPICHSLVSEDGYYHVKHTCNAHSFWH